MRPRPAKAALFAVLGTVCVVIAPFLAGAVGIFIRADLGIDESRLGISVACAFAVSAVCSIPGGRIAQRLGAWRALRVALLLATLTLALVAFAARDWGSFTVLMALAGLPNALGQPAANLAIAHFIAGNRQGFGYGVKQSAPRVATLLAGLAVPVLGLTVGWRWAFGGVAALSVLLALSIPRHADADTRSGADAPRHPAMRRNTLRPRMLVLSTGAFFAQVAATSLGVFLVETAVASGVGPGAAGLLLTIGSAAGITSRLIVGWTIDRVQTSAFTFITAMLLVGACAYLVLGSATQYWLLLLGTMLAFVFGWGWNGLMVYLVVSLNPGRPAEASGVSQTGVFAGGVVGPAAFGLLASNFSFSVAWYAATGSVLIGAALVFLAKTMAFDRPTLH